MFYNNCSGCLQVPVPVHYWNPYIVPAKKSSFHIADILRHHMSSSVPQVCQDLTRKHSDVKHNKINDFKRSREQECTTISIKHFKRSQVAQSDNAERSNQRDVVECSLPSALAPLQALCSADVKSRTVQKSHSKRTDTNSSLKFGINRILSEDFGQEKTEKGTNTWTASSEFGTYRICEQRRFRRACASAQSRQNLRCSLIQAVSQEEPSDRKPDPWPL